MRDSRAAFHDAVGEGVNLPHFFPAEAVSVNQPWADAQRARAGGGHRRFAEKIHGEDRLGVGTHPQHRHLCVGQMRRRVPLRVVDGVLLGGHVVLVNVAAAIDGDDKCEARIHTRDGAHRRPAPRNPREADFLRVDFRKGAQQRVGANHIGHRMVKPLLLVRQRDVAEPPITLRPRVLVSLVWRKISLHSEKLPTRQMPLQIHRDGRIAALVPLPHPRWERRPAAAMRAHHRRPAALRRFPLRRGVVGKHPSRLPLVFQPLVEK